MAAFEDAPTVLRKRIKTYGKANRRQIPGRSFAPTSQKQQTPGIPYQHGPAGEHSAVSKASEGKVKSIQKSQARQERASQKDTDVYDMPSSDDDTAPVRPRPRPTIKKTASKIVQKTAQGVPKATSTGVGNVENIQRSPASQASSSPGSPMPPDIYDLPSSSDEPTPKPVRRTTQKINQKDNSNNARNSTAPISLPEFAKVSKRRKLSPIEPAQPAQQPAQSSPIKPAMKALQNLGSGSPQGQQLKLPKAHPTRMATRPKFQTRTRKPELQNNPAKPTSVTKSILSPKSPSPSATSATGLDNVTNYISPRASKMWKGLLDSAGEDDSDITMGNTDEGHLDLSKKYGSMSPPPIPSRTLFKPAGVSKRPQKNARSMPRRRLIDSLVEQADIDDYSEEESSSSDKSEADAQPEEPTKMSHDKFAEILSQTLGQESAPTMVSASQGSQGVGPKITYSRQRSMLAEADLMQQLALDMPVQPAEASQQEKPRRGIIPPFKKITSFDEDEEMSDLAPAVTSVHELRQAGANQRFLEEAEDFLDRIGKPVLPPSSMRRSGLSELASKIKDKAFLRQFRDNGIEQRLFLHLGQEQDVVAGFYMISLLMVVLVDANMPHIVAHLRRQGVTRLLIRLVCSAEGIVRLGKERKNNMSKMSLGLLKEHHDHLLSSPVWGELQPQILSPRTVALKCLELMVRQTREAGKSEDIFSKEMTTNLFEILKSAPNDNAWMLPNGQQAIDFYLALSVLELHSIKAMTAHDESIWISEYLPTVADTIEISLDRPSDKAGTLQYMLLRLIVNVTNNDPKASDVFAKQGVMNALGQAINTKFEMISRFMTEEDLTEAVAQLVVSLGVMINLSESPAARKCFNSLQKTPKDPLEKMVELFIGNQETMAEANTQEESQRNVPFGYLSILLGYLALDAAISERVRKRLPGKTLRPLLTSIEQFISYHKAVDDMLEAEDDGYNRQTGLTERLESLVEKLVAPKGSGSK